jgi:acyl transferase domain-containing protein
VGSDYIYKIDDGTLVTSSLPRYVYPLSGHDKKALQAQADRLRLYLEKNPDVFDVNLMSDLAYTLGQRRTKFQWRTSFHATSSSKLITQLSMDYEAQQSPEQPITAFTFTGQGAQWLGMGRDLLPVYPAFAETLQAADRALQKLDAKFSIIGKWPTL